MSVGKITAFDPLKDNWVIYVERLEQYFLVNEVKEDLKVATLITVMGSDAYELLVNLCTPDKPSTKSFAALVEIMKNHLQPRPSILAERYKFRQRKQSNSECIADYVTDLKKLSITCNFGTWLTESLRDQFVCGLKSDGIRQRLFAEEDLKFDKALKLAVTMEAAEADAAMVEGSRDGDKYRHGDGHTLTATTSIHKTGLMGERWQRDGKPATRGRGKVKVNAVMRGALRSGSAGAAGRMDDATSVHWRGQWRPCVACGAHHDFKTCKFKRYVCRACCKEGHLKRMCPRLAQYSTSYSMREESAEKDIDDVISDEVAAILLMIFTILSMIQFVRKSYPESYLVFGAIAIVLLTLEIVFSILFLVSAHRKNDVYLKIYYRYAISILILEVICLLLYVGFEVFLVVDFPFVIFIIQFMVQTTCFVLAMIVLQIYFIILVRSEIQKLQNNSKFEFVNHTSDPVCKVVM